MDQKVKDTQEWVNATYKKVPGYQPCPENGTIGWSTIYSLVMGLQHELGITTLVANFGPGTIAKLSALGAIGVGWKKNKNIVRILQYGLFCKGYWGANSLGTFDARTGAAVSQLRTNMGIPPSGDVTADVFRCILNMDAYIVVAGGTEKIRGIQQWLNGRYYTKSEFSIGPADGIYSRDVQKSLVIALQYELGITEPNGNFGPSTQGLLKKHTLTQGATGIFVQLFSAACVFNEPVPSDPTRDSSEDVRTNMRASFDAGLATFVRSFQKFSQLPETGTGDYPTWAQLLVSMGDPERTTTGCDTRFEITEARAIWLKTHGYQIVGRYLYNPAPGPGEVDLNKNIKLGELERIFAHGMRVFPIFQDNGRRIEDFTYSQGFQHGLLAHHLATGFGFSAGTVIYFAVDTDFTQEDITSAVIPYFQGVQAGLASKGKKYLHGVYGSRNVCANVTQETFARFSFVSGMSWGFSGNLGYPLPKNWSVNQIKEFHIDLGDNSFDLDKDVWRNQGGDAGQSSISAPVHGAIDFVDSVEKLYDLAKQYGKSDANVLVCNYYRHSLYNDFKWKIVIDPVDQGFVDFANSHGATLVSDAVDPETGYSLDTQHLMATLEGHLKIPKPADGMTNAGDVLGWGGDLFTFYADWRKQAERYASGYDFCQARFAIPGVETSFGYSDLLVDADGYLLAQNINAGTSVADAIRHAYQQPGTHQRIRRFFYDRFTNANKAKNITHNLLAGSTDGAVVGARTILMGAVMQPPLLSAQKLDEFERGFTDALVKRLDQ